MSKEITYIDLFRKEKLQFWYENDEIFYQFRMIVYGYAVDEYNLSDEQKTLIKNLLNVVNRPRYSLSINMIAGYASKTGNTDHNMELSGLRVDALYEFITAYFQDIPNSQSIIDSIEINRLGDTVLEVDSDLEEYYNRRTELIYSINVKVPPPTQSTLSSRKWKLDFNQSLSSSNPAPQPAVDPSPGGWLKNFKKPNFGLGGEIGLGEIEILADEITLTTAQLADLSESQKKRKFKYLSLGGAADISFPWFGKACKFVNRLVKDEMENFLELPIDVVANKLENLAPIISYKLGQLIGNASASLFSYTLGGSRIDFLIPISFEDFENSLFSVAKFDFKLNLVAGGSLSFYIIGFYPLGKMFTPGQDTLDVFTKSVAYSWSFGFGASFDPMVVKMDTSIYVSPIGTIFQVDS